MKTWLFFWVLACSPAIAGNALFEKGAGAVWIVPLDSKGELRRIDLAAKKSTVRKLPAPLAAAEIAGIARLPDGALVLTAAGAVWKWYPTAGKPVKLADLPAGFSPEDTTCVSRKGSVPEGTIVLHGTKGDDPEETLIALQPGAKRFSRVFCRRFRPCALPAISADGRLFFGGEADVWEGRFDVENDMPEDDPMMTVSGCRIAPLALENTDGANSGSMMVREIAVGKSTVYARLNGRHMGAVVAFPLRAKPLYPEDYGDHPGLADAYVLMRDTLAKTCVIHESDALDSLCVETDAKGSDLVFWRELVNGRKWMLKSGDAKPVEIGKE